MVFIYNFAPYIFAIPIALMIYFLIPSRTGKVFIAICAVFMIFVYIQAQPSYGPKGEVNRMVPVIIHQTESKIQDVVPKPETPEMYDSRMELQRQNIAKRMAEIQQRSN